MLHPDDNFNCIFFSLLQVSYMFAALSLVVQIMSGFVSSMLVYYIDFERRGPKQSSKIII